MPSTVSWRYDTTTERWLYWLLLAGTAAVYGVFSVVLAGAAVALFLALVGGSTGLRLLVVVLALVGGPFSLLYLLPMLRDPAQRPTFYPDGVERRLHTRERVGAGVVGALVLAGSAWVDPRLAVGLFLGGACAGVLVLACSTRGRIDPETATAESGPREWDLSRVTGYTVRRIGPLAVVSLEASGPGSFGTVPSRVVVPTTALDDVSAALDAVVAEVGERDEEGRDPNPAVRAVAAAFALLFAGGGAAAAVFVGTVGWYAAAVGLLFAAVFLLVAREG
jgi:fatty acid desaturase